MDHYPIHNRWDSLSGTLMMIMHNPYQFNLDGIKITRTKSIIQMKFMEKKRNQK
uniref:Uncharacterized protein n=1 Tax=Rhizophora mucronata TaxID=61149 RepID=A0A2P2QVY3_RHIMU